LGAAWNDREAKGLGIPFPPLKERFERLEETLQIAHQMWRGEMRPFEGQYYHLAEPLNVPAPLTRPHPPILIGGMGEEKTFRLIARYADACNLFTRAGTETVRAKLEALRRRCDEAGRNYDDIEKTALSSIYLGPGKMTAADVIAHCREMAGLGIQHLIFNMPNVYEIRPLETLAREVIPEVAGL
jgi:alkanesulfonate monooxygenase SsuD/methylene tetrahydromethanopterin reductase-like flavin-dependent oxidoreductase (luciferase family)